jgi:DNA-binding LacI/PurR family transcriptional regulator
VPNARLRDDGDLPRAVQVGDRIKLRAERVAAYEAACAAAGYNFDPHACQTVTRMDAFGARGGTRLWVSRPPFMFAPNDVVLAWNSDAERREMLRRRSRLSDTKILRGDE